MLNHKVITLVLIILVILAFTADYRYLQHGVGQTTSSVSAHRAVESSSISGKAWYDNVVLRVNYTAIEDPRASICCQRIH